MAPAADGRRPTCVGIDRRPDGSIAVTSLGRVERLLELALLDGLYIAGRLDGPHQAVLHLGFAIVEHRLPRRPAHAAAAPRASAARRPTPWWRRRWRCIAVDFFVTQAAHRADVLDARTAADRSSADYRRRGARRRARRSSSFDNVSLAFDEKVILRDVSFTLIKRAHEDHPRRERRRKSTILKLITRAAEAGRRRRSG